MAKTKKYVVWAFVCFLAGCASSNTAAAPEWIFATPPPDAHNTYFTGSASDATGDQSRATQSALDQVVSRVMQYIGIRIAVTTTATQKATLDSYEAAVRSTLQSQSNNRIAGFLLKETFVQRDKGSPKIIVYILASYLTADLQREKSRIAALFAEVDQAVSVPEGQGIAFEAAGQLYDAARKYLEAASAATAPGIENSQIKIERNLAHARSALGKIHFESRTPAQLTTTLGNAFDKPIAFLVVGAAGKPVPGAMVELSYKAKSGTRVITRSLQATSDETGLVTVTLPAPTIAGSSAVDVSLDFASSLGLFGSLPASQSAMLQALEQDIYTNTLTIPIVVLPSKNNLAMVTAIVDVGPEGVPQKSQLCQDGFLDAMAAAGVRASPLALGQATQDEASIVKLASATNPKDLLIVGQARIAGVRQDGNQWIAEARVRLVAYKAQTRIYSAELVSFAVASDKAGAADAALRQAGFKAMPDKILPLLGQ